MLQFTVIGNLGQNAELKTINGRQYVTFDVAHSNSWTDEAGNEHSEMLWVSCIMSGDGGKLLQYLTKGRKVFVSGDGSVRCYSSAVQRRMMAGANISVRQIELLGGAADEVPRRLVTSTGEVVETYKAYYINPDVSKKLCPGTDDRATLSSERGEQFEVVQAGWITKVKQDEQEHF